MNTTFTVLRNAAMIQADIKLAEGTTRDDAAQIAALFPKSLKLTASLCSGEGSSCGFVRMQISLKGTKANGGTNEAGLARYAKFKAHAEKLGFALVSHKWSTEAL